LKRLKLKANRISSIKRDDFASLTSLEYLDLSRNKISTIDPQAFDKLISLKKLKINSNKLSWIDSNAFKNLIKLQELELHDNLLKKYDFALSVESLTLLDLDMNMIEGSFKASEFSKLVNLEKLFLGSNSLTSIEKNSLKDSNILPKLKKINLCYNKIQIENFPSICQSWIRIKEIST
jgi:Leucine-rich repeat (LRR) protein